jgi:hypothetical protein
MTAALLGGDRRLAVDVGHRIGGVLLGLVVAEGGPTVPPEPGRWS